MIVSVIVAETVVVGVSVGVFDGVGVSVTSSVGVSDGIGVGVNDGSGVSVGMNAGVGNSCSLLALQPPKTNINITHEPNRNVYARAVVRFWRVSPIRAIPKCKPNRTKSVRRIVAPIVR